MNVIVTGSLGYDYIMDFSGRFADRIMPDKIHKISLSPLVDTLHKQFGGTAGNIAYSLKLLGIEPLILTCSGNDFDTYEKFLFDHQISTKYIKQIKNTTCSIYFVVTDKEDNQIGAYYKGALSQNKKSSIEVISEPIDYMVISPNDKFAMINYVKECITKKIKYMYDPAFQTDDFTPEELSEGIKNADVLIGNDYEISLMEQKLSINHEELIVSGPKLVITTIGSKGSVIENRKASIHIQPAKPKSTVDPTGAGDAYRSGFLSGYLRGFDLATCSRMGSVAAVYTVEKYGTVTHNFTQTEFCQRYQDNFGEKLLL